MITYPRFAETIDTNLESFQKWIKGIARIVEANRFYEIGERGEYWMEYEFTRDRTILLDDDHPFPVFEFLCRDPHQRIERPALWVEIRDLGDGKVQVLGFGDTDIPRVEEILQGIHAQIVLTFKSQVVTNANNERGDGTPRVPTRPTAKKRWRAVWDKIRTQAARGTSCQDISNWLDTTQHTELKFSAETVADIIRAGEAGLLG